MESIGKLDNTMWVIISTINELGAADVINPVNFSGDLAFFISCCAPERELIPLVSCRETSVMRIRIG